MADEFAENGAENEPPAEFEPLKNEETEEFPDRHGEEKVIDADILLETKTAATTKADAPEDDFSRFLANLPSDEHMSFVVTRLSDRNHSGSFRLPCLTNEQLETLYWNGESDPTEIYSQITRLYGGGVYRIQSRAKRGFVKEATWQVTLGDPAFLSEREKLLRKEEANTSEPQRTVESSQQFQPPPPSTRKSFFKEAMEEAQDYKAFQDFFAPPAPTAPVVTVSEEKVTKETIKMELVKNAMNDPQLIKEAMYAVFDITPPKSTQPKGWFDRLIENETAVTIIVGAAAPVVAPLVSVITKFITPTVPPAGQTATATATAIQLRKPAINTQAAAQPETQAQPAQTQQDTPAPPTQSEQPTPAADKPKLPSLFLK